MEQSAVDRLTIIALLIVALVGCKGNADTSSSGGSTSATTPPPTTGNRSPTARISGTSTIGPNVNVDAGDSTDPDGDALTYNWAFGDGQIGSGVRASHTYGTSGSYTIRLTVSDGQASASISVNVQVTVSGAQFPQPFDTNAVYTRDIYVATNGNDATGNGSAAAPYASIGRAFSQVGAGTRVRVQSGTYGAAGSFGGIQGTAQNPIAIVADGAVVIDAGGIGNGMALSGTRYLVLQGLTFQNTGIHGLNIDDGGIENSAEYVVLRNLRFRNIGSGNNNDCLKMSGINNFYVEDSEFERCNRGEAIDMVGCHNGTISANHFHDIIQNGVQTKGGSADILIHGNRFVDVPSRAINAGGNTDAAYFRPANAAYEAARIQIVANTFLRVTAPIAFVGCDSCVFANNTLIEPRTWVARILEENTSRGPGHSGYFINNLIVFNTADMGGTYVNVGPNTQPGTYTFGWNLWYALDNSNFAGPPYSGGVSAEISSVIQLDPMLDNRLGGDYHIGTTTSPAIGRGRSVPRGLVADYDRRAYAATPTIGAFTAP